MLILHTDVLPRRERAGAMASSMRRAWTRRARSPISEATVASPTYPALVVMSTTTKKHSHDLFEFANS